MNILHVLDHSLPIHSGYAFRSAEILRALDKMGYGVTARTGPKHDREHETQGFEFDDYYKRSFYSNRLLRSIPIVEQLEVIRILRRDIRGADMARPVDVIHAHSPSLNGMAAIWAAKSQAIPVVYEMRASWEDAAVDHGTARPDGLRYKMTQQSESWVFRHADAITTICEGLKGNICARGIPEGKVTVIPNGVDPDRFRPLPDDRGSLKQKYGATDRFAIVFCGSYYSYEGLDLLISAMPEFVSKFPRALVLLAGGGEQEESLKERVQSLQLDEYVRFLGRVSQESVVELYNLADVCVFPRRRMKLTDMVTPLKPLEAMAAGALVLASDVNGHKELISNHETGLLFKADDHQALVSQLSRAYLDTNFSAIRKSAREYILAERTWPACASRYEGVYRRVTSSRT